MKGLFKDITLLRIKVLTHRTMAKTYLGEERAVWSSR